MANGNKHLLCKQRVSQMVGAMTDDDWVDWLQGEEEGSRGVRIEVSAGGGAFSDVCYKLRGKEHVRIRTPIHSRPIQKERLFAPSVLFRSAVANSKSSVDRKPHHGCPRTIRKLQRVRENQREEKRQGAFADAVSRVGVFSTLTNSYALVAVGASENFYRYAARRRVGQGQQVDKIGTQCIRG